MSLTSRLSLRYLLLLVLLFRPPTIMMIDLLACWNGPLGCLSPAGRQVTLLVAILQRVVVTSLVVAAIIVLAATSVVVAAVVVAT
jgi:hypothetical protein